MSTAIIDAIGRKYSPPQYDYMFRVELPIDFAGGGPEINHRVYSVNTPFRTIEPFKNTVAGHFFYTAGHGDIGGLSARIEEMADGLTFSYLMDWQKRVRNPDGTYNPPATYLRNIVVVSLDAAGRDLKKITYKHCFPSEITPVSWSYDNSNIQGYEVTFTGSDITFG